jgi:hypothetical protein
METDDISFGIVPIKNPLSGHLYVPAVGEIIKDIAGLSTLF